MANMSLKKVPMPEQDPNVRNKNFEEVALGYTKEMAMEEATRCLNCKNKPCVGGCPVNVPIPAFIEKVAAGDFEGAYEVITTENALPAICGRVCPQENQCEVDFPDPDDPMIEMISPSLMSKEISFNTVRSPNFFSKFLTDKILIFFPPNDNSSFFSQ